LANEVGVAVVVDERNKCCRRLYVNVGEFLPEFAGLSDSIFFEFDKLFNTWCSANNFSFSTPLSDATVNANDDVRSIVISPVILPVIFTGST